MGDQILETLPGLPRDPKIKRLRARRDICGRDWKFHRGLALEGYRDEDGSWTVWPEGQHFARLCCVPASHITIKS